MEPSGLPPRRDLDDELSEFIGATPERRQELSFRLLLVLLHESRSQDERLTRHGRRLYALEEAARTMPKTSYRPPPKGEAEVTGRFELQELRDDQKWRRRLVVTTIVTVSTMLVLGTLGAFARLVWTLAINSKGTP